MSSCYRHHYCIVFPCKRHCTILLWNGGRGNLLGAWAGRLSTTAVRRRLSSDCDWSLVVWDWQVCWSRVPQPAPLHWHATGQAEVCVAVRRVISCSVWIDSWFVDVVHATYLCLWSPYGIGQTIIFSSCGFFFYLSFFPRQSQPSQIGCLPYFHTWCGLGANFRCRSETCCTRLTENTGRRKVPKNRHLAPSHNFVGLYFRN